MKTEEIVYTHLYNLKYNTDWPILIMGLVVGVLVVIAVAIFAQIPMEVIGMAVLTVLCLAVIAIIIGVLGFIFSVIQKIIGG